MSSDIEELTVEYNDNGIATVKEVDKVVLSKGAWTTIIFKYQTLDRRSGKYGPDRYSIRRYQKREGAYRLKSKFTISSNDQAQKVIAVLKRWLEKE